MNTDEKKEMSTLCSICGKLFSRASYRNHHMRHVHKVNCWGEQLPSKLYTCVLCAMDFEGKSQLRDHLKTVHLPEDENKKLFNCDMCDHKTTSKNNMKNHVSKEHGIVIQRIKKECPTQFDCNYCEAKFSLITQLKIHERKAHNIAGPLRKPFERKCPMCPYSSSSRKRKEINNHLEKEHGIHLEWMSICFNTFDEFSKWKSELEEQTNARYNKRDITAKRHQFVCHRSGMYQRRENVRARKSCKINAYCPSEIIANILPNDCVKVSYLQTHVGHTEDSKSEEKIIPDTKIENINPYREILVKNIKGKVTKIRPKRVHLIARIVNTDDCLEQVTHEENELEMGIGHYEEVESEFNVFETICVESVENEQYVVNEEYTQNEQYVDNEEYSQRKLIYDSKVEELVEFLRTKVVKVQHMDFVEDQINQLMTMVHAME